jgi:multiple sugar transport system substrate-binding protein
MFKAHILKWFVVLLAFSVFVACAGNTGDAISSNGKDQSGESVSKPAKDETAYKSTEPVKVVIYSNWNFPQEYFDKIFVQPLKKKAPNITLDIVIPPKNGLGKLQEIIGAGNVPDVIIGNTADTQDLVELGVASDLSGLIKQYNLNISGIDPQFMDSLKRFSSKGEILTLPYQINFMALFYNKDIFDKFGEPYPKDGITWDEVIAKARKLSKTEDGVQYVGFDPNSVMFLASPLTNEYFDPKTGKANLSTPEWKRAYEMLNQIISIPNNRFPGKLKRWHNPEFANDKNIAMNAVPNMIPEVLATAQGLNWDMTTYPVYSDHPGIAPFANGRGLYISSTSKVKDAAFQVIATLLSEDVQKIVSANGEGPAVKTPEVVGVFAKDLPYAAGKNTQSAVKVKQNAPMSPTKYDTLASGIVFNHTADLYNGKDINTVIRETEEEINKKVAEEASK